MKRVFMIIFAALTAVFVAMPLSGTAEAARVAAVPIQINEKQVERATDFVGYYWDIMVGRFKYPDYELMDDEKVTDLLPEGELSSYDEATLTKLADTLGAEIVVAMKLDKVSERPIAFRNEGTLATHMQGEFASYNRLTGKYYFKKIYYKGEMLEVLTLRSDWQQDAFAAELKRCLNRALEDKKKKKK